MPLNLTTLGRLAVLILLLCLTSSATAKIADYPFNKSIVSNGNDSSSVSGTVGMTGAGADASLCLTGLCPMGVWALCEYNGDLYAGGQFTSADGQTARYIARWDGSQWHDVGGGMNHYVYDLLVYDGKLIAGGVFDTVNGMAKGHIAAWDGVSWTPLGEGVNRRPGIWDMIVYNGDLIVTGTFDSAGSVASKNYALWNGTSWEAFGPEGGVGCYSMTIFQGDLILSNALGGGFSRWDGSSWTTIPIPMNGGTYSLDAYNDQLIAGGFFVTAGEDTVNHIIAWDGVNWTPLDGGIGPEYAKGSNVSVQSLFNYGGDLIVGGNFTLAGGDTANYIARWDGSSWHPIGGGMGGTYDEDHWVTALTEYNGDLVAGGFFTTAEGMIVNRIAAWDGDAWRPLTAKEGMPFAIEVSQNQAVASGAMASVPVTKVSGSSTMYGFDMLVSYDADHLSFAGVDPGPLFDSTGDFQWEYFEYRADTGLVRIVGLAETNNGPHHPLSGDVPNGTVLFDLNLVGVVISPGEFIPTNLGFRWEDCGDNAIVMDSLGYDLAISDSVYDADGVNITDHGATFPTNAGAPDECLGGGSTPVTRFIDFYGGKLYVVDTTQIDYRGDINLNGIPYEIADEVMFTNFFLQSFAAFGTHPEASTAASDVNADGIPLRLEDLMFMHRIICGDTVPVGFRQGGAVLIDTALFIQDVTARTVSVESSHALCGVFMRFDGEIFPEFSPIMDTSVYIRASAYDGEYTRVLIFPNIGVFESCQDTGFSPGTLFSYTGYGRLIMHFDPDNPGWDSPQAVDCEARRLLIANPVISGVNGWADVWPHTQPASLGRTSPDSTVLIYGHGFSGYTPSDVDLTSVRVNDSLIPLSVTVLPSHPMYSGEVLEIIVPAREFIGGYGAITDTSDFVLRVSGTFLDDEPFVSQGKFTIYPQSAMIRVPDHWPTIGEAVESAITGDTVLVADGVYSGEGDRDLTVHDKNLVMRSENGPDATIIDCGGSESEYHYFLSYLDSLNETIGRLEGITVRNAYGDSMGAVYVNNAAVTISHCRFENNYSTGGGGAIRIQNASSRIEFCLFANNHAVTGGAIANSSGAADMVKCTFVANSADGSGGALFVEGAAPSVTNCLFAFGAGGGAIAVSNMVGSPSVSCTDIYGNVGGDWIGGIAGELGQNGNFSADPLFCDAANGDYHLNGYSPCLDVNNDCFMQVGVYGLGCGFLCGDASGNSRVNIGDVVFLINYIFKGGPAPASFLSSDLNGDGLLEIGDAVVLIDFIFRGGPPLDCQPE